MLDLTVIDIIGTPDMTKLHGIPYALAETGTVVVFVAVTVKEVYLRVNAALELPADWPVTVTRAIVSFVKFLFKK